MRLVELAELQILWLLSCSHFWSQWCFLAGAMTIQQTPSWGCLVTPWCWLEKLKVMYLSTLLLAQLFPAPYSMPENSLPRVHIVNQPKWNLILLRWFNSIYFLYLSWVGEGNSVLEFEVLLLRWQTEWGGKNKQKIVNCIHTSNFIQAEYESKIYTRGFPVQVMESWLFRIHLTSQSDGCQKWG